MCGVFVCYFGMPISLQCDTHFPVSEKDARLLWSSTVRFQHCSDDVVTVRCVSSVEIQRLNRQYRNKDAPTNVLTFTYPASSGDGSQEHDIALCLTVAKREAHDRHTAVHDYVALLLVHAFLHAAGLDHESSSDAAQRYAHAEREILSDAGFRADSL